MQKRFTQLVNKLDGLGKTIPHKDLTNKVLRCLSREWQPKVIVIKESRNFATMTITTLFRMLEEHEYELIRLNKHKEIVKKKIKDKEKKKDKHKKSLALKASSSKAKKGEQSNSSESDKDCTSDEEMNLSVTR